jgi:hypothetical protein
VIDQFVHNVAYRLLHHLFVLSMIHYHPLIVILSKEEKHFFTFQTNEKGSFFLKICLSKNLIFLLILIKQQRYLAVSTRIYHKNQMSLFDIDFSSPHFQTPQHFPVMSTMLPSGNTGQFISGSTSGFMRPPSPPILGIPNAGYAHSLSSGHTFPPQVIYKPNNQEINYKQNIMIRWLKPPTPPPRPPIIIRGRFHFFID